MRQFVPPGTAVTRLCALAEGDELAEGCARVYCAVGVLRAAEDEEERGRACAVRGVGASSLRRVRRDARVFTQRPAQTRLRSGSSMSPWRCHRCTASARPRASGFHRRHYGVQSARRPPVCSMSISRQVCSTWPGSPGSVGPWVRQTDAWCVVVPPQFTICMQSAPREIIASFNAFNGPFQCPDSLT
ncbi:hypothetical protein B0H16DRAFT_1501156 [Mycena metata]|uniref:Uncharacterized protein n=1 Tax=Mycena metata TaxID=1033252 RepID=A0AAD7K5Y6_9AGAR|nr:hypothetical protein B0H16DRAFT_1501156 [Mycena metata]